MEKVVDQGSSLALDWAFVALRYEDNVDKLTYKLYIDEKVPTNGYEDADTTSVTYTEEVNRYTFYIGYSADTRKSFKG